MAKAIPLVRQALLSDPKHAGARIPVDSAAWFAWLAAPTTTSFSYALFNRARGYIDGFMTLRKERRQRGSAYWSVYRRQEQRLCKIYIGPSKALTLARLEQIAARLHSEKGELFSSDFTAERLCPTESYPTGPR